MEERAAAIAGSEQGVQAAGAQKAELPGGFQGEGGDCGEGDRLWLLFRLVGGDASGSHSLPRAVFKIPDGGVMEAGRVQEAEQARTRTSETPTVGKHDAP